MLLLIRERHDRVSGMMERDRITQVYACVRITDGTPKMYALHCMKILPKKLNNIFHYLITCTPKC